ncbi:MAG: RNA polymerase sigma factor [Myxococcaceae bacterium]
MRVYWRPLYVYLRHKGLDATGAQDGVQDVLVLLMERDVIDKVNPSKGRLRAYLKTMAANYLANEHERATAKKRGGDAALVPLELETAERLIADGTSPDVAFEQQWAQAVMDKALARLESEFTSGERKGPWPVVRQFFTPGPQPSYRDVAQEHGMSLPQLKAFLHRARGRFRELVTEEISDTVESDADAEQELNELLRVLSP